MKIELNAPKEQIKKFGFKITSKKQQGEFFEVINGWYFIN